MPDQRARLCIVSHDRISCGVFVAALETALSPHDELEIIVDRRRGGPAAKAKSDAADRPSEDRRHHAHVDRMLRMDGFAIVPAPGAEPNGTSGRLSLLLPEAPIAGLAFEDADDRDRLESVLSFKRGRSARLAIWLALAGLAGAVTVLLALSSPMKTLMSRVRPEPPPSAGQPPPARQDSGTSTVAQHPLVGETPASTGSSVVTETPPSERAESPPPDAGRELPAAGSPAANPQSERPRDSTTASARSRESGALPGAATGPVASAPRPSVPARSSPSATVTSRPSASVPPQDTPVARATPSSRFAGLPVVELVRNPAPAASGSGDVYAVRIFDTAGQPLAGADVLLIARMADGTVASIPLDSGAEPGTYRGTMPAGRSAPLDLRVRVMTSDKRVEIPLRP